MNRSVKRLEETLARGALVSSDTSGRTTLTHAGERLLGPARRFVAAAELLIQTEPVVRFSAYPSVVQQVLRANPALLRRERHVELFDVAERTRRGGGEALVRDVFTGRLDLAVAPHNLGGGDLDEYPLYEWTLRAILPAGSPALTVITPAELARHDIAAAPPGHRSRTLLQSAFDIDGIRLAPALESASQDLLLEVARHSDRHAVVLPDDALGEVDPALGPALVSNSGDPYGGRYSLYLRSVRPTEAGPHDERVARVADIIRQAFAARYDASRKPVDVVRP